jgi:biopolymer transport protein ExbD
MAEMSSEGGGGGHHKQRGGRRSKKVSTRIDMTPMVDLGFLLITFFIFTTTMSKPSSMEVLKPDTSEKPPEANKVKESHTMTILMGKDNKIFYYFGINDPDHQHVPQINVTDYSEKGLRRALLDKDKEVRDRTGYKDPNDKEYSKNGAIIIIKPLKNSTYKNLVDVLDEMKVTNIKSFALAEPAPVDLEILEKSKLNK